MLGNLNPQVTGNCDLATSTDYANVFSIITEAKKMSILCVQTNWMFPSRFRDFAKMTLTRVVDCDWNRATIVLNVTRVQSESLKIVTRVESLTRVTLSLHVPTSVEQIWDFCNPNPVQNFFWVIRSDSNPVDLFKYFIQSSLCPKNPSD